MRDIDFNKIKKAVQDIANGELTKVYIEKDCLIYKIPSKNPDINVIRIDIKGV